MKGNSDTAEAYIKELEKELRNRESELKTLQERLKNNEDMLQDAIDEKNKMKLQLQEYELTLTDNKLNQHQKLQEDHNKTVHRLQVTKKQLDDARTDISDLKEIIDELANRGLLDHIRGKYPESFEEYKGKK